MGDRSSIIITSERFANPITFYGHWSGDHNLKAVQNVLARTGRVGDPSYLAAEIFYEFAINLGSYDGNLSFGIGAWGDNDYTWDDNDPVFVNADTGEVTLGERIIPIEVGG